MFGCCNSLFSNSCRCSCCNGNSSSCGSGGVTPSPVFPPLPPPAPTPMPTLRGLEAAFTAGSGATVANGFPIPFDTLISNNAVGASFSTGAIVLNRPGTYLVNWWVATDNADQAVTETAGQTGAELSFSAALDGSVIASAYAPTGTGQVSGAGLVTVKSTPATLQIVNNSGGNVVLAQTTEQAGVVVTQFA